MQPERGKWRAEKCSECKLCVPKSTVQKALPWTSKVPECMSNNAVLFSPLTGYSEIWGWSDWNFDS